MSRIEEDQLLSEHAFPSDESMTIRICAAPAGRVTLCITIYSCVAERKKTLRARREWYMKRGLLVINMHKVS